MNELNSFPGGCLVFSTPFDEKSVFFSNYVSDTFVKDYVAVPDGVYWLFFDTSLDISRKGVSKLKNCLYHHIGSDACMLGIFLIDNRGGHSPVCVVPGLVRGPRLFRIGG